MTNLIAIIIIVLFIYGFFTYFSDKKRRSSEKELQQKNQFFNDIQPLLQQNKKNDPVLTNTNQFSSSYLSLVITYYKNQGYKLSEHAKKEGIDLIGLREKELIMIDCHEERAGLNLTEIKIFIANSILHMEKNPMLSSRQLKRVIVVNQPLQNPQLIEFFNTYAHSIEYFCLPFKNESLPIN